MRIAEFLGLWALFYAGFVVSLLLQAQTSVTSKSNGLTSVFGWLKLHWHVVTARLFLSAIFSPLLIHYIPSGLGLPIWSVYGSAGFIADSLLDKVLFMFGQGVGMKVEVPQVVPPAPSPPSPGPPA
jgi:hypothetical protein